MDLSTIPSREQLEEAKRRTPAHMSPNVTPSVAIAEGFLSGNQCDGILEYMKAIEPYKYAPCHATTREAPMPVSPVLWAIAKGAQTLNSFYWDFVLFDAVGAWMQEYQVGDFYNGHTDAGVGQSRKLTAVAMLSPEHAYEGGDLTVRLGEQNFRVPRKRGTIAVFPSWVYHFVTPVTAGERYTINMGFWGPGFR